MSSVFEILTGIGYEPRDFGRSYRCKPLYRDSNNNTSLVVDKDTGKWHDFSTNQQGELPELIKITLNLGTDADLSKYMSGFVPIQTGNNVKIDQQKVFSKDLLIKLRKDYSYWEGRGVSKGTLELFGGGIADNGKMANRYVFPIYNSRDEIVGFAGRDLTGFAGSKWKLLGAKSLWCYPLKNNIETITEQRQAIIVESIGDMLALWEAGIKNVIVSFGTDISAAIIALLIRLDVDEIILAFNNEPDNNDIGGVAAGKAQNRLLNHFDERQIRIALPTKKDFGVMTHQEITDWKKPLTK